MLNEQQEEKVQELANTFKKLAEISNDDYFLNSFSFQIVLEGRWSLKKIKINCLRNYLQVGKML